MTRVCANPLTPFEKPSIHMVVVWVFCFCIQTAALANTDTIHLEYVSEPLSTVFERVSAATGVTITVDGLEKNTLVSGKIEQSSLDEAVRLILQRFNSTIVWDDMHNAIYIIVYQQAGPKSLDPYPSSPGGIQQDTTPKSVTDATPASPFAAEQWFQQALDYAKPSPAPTVQDGRISGGGRRFIQGTPTTP